MQDFDLTNSTGYLNVERMTNGSVHIFIEAKEVQITLSRAELVKLTEWLVNFIYKTGN